MESNSDSLRFLGWVCAVGPPVKVSVGSGGGGIRVKMRLLQEEHFDPVFVHFIEDLPLFRGNIETLYII